MEGGPISRKKIVIIAVCCVLILVAAVAAVIYANKGIDEVSFDANEEAFFTVFTYGHEPEDFKIESVDAYYYKKSSNAIGKYYFHAVYTIYFEPDEEWFDIDEITYGGYGQTENTFCLNWDDIEGFESQYEDYKEAVEKGVHKSYTKEEIDSLVEEYCSRH